MTTIFYAAIAVALSTFLNLGLNAFTLLQIIKINDTLRYQTLGFNTIRGEIVLAADAINVFAQFSADAVASSTEFIAETEALLNLHPIAEDVETGKAEKPLDDQTGLSADSIDASAKYIAEVEALLNLHPIAEDAETGKAEKPLDDQAGSAHALKQILEEMSPIIGDAQTPFDDFFADAESVQAVQTRVDRMNDFVEKVVLSAKVQPIGDAVQDATDFWNDPAPVSHKV